MFEMSNKLNKLCFKGLSPYIFKVEKLNWVKVLENY